ncbi:MAG: hypothetical protein R3C49_26105 [Planctomycetaceae bacterium]
MPDMQTAISRVQSGIRHLDELYGREWRAKINLSWLDISSPRNCILGQLMRHGHLALLFTDVSTGVACGFSCGLWDLLFFCQPPWVSRSFDRLTEAWKLALSEPVVSDSRPVPARPSQRGNIDRNDSGRGTYSCAG